MIKEDTDWTKFGYNRFLTNSIEPIDKQFMTGEEFNSLLQDSSILINKFIGNGVLVTKIIASGTVTITTDATAGIWLNNVNHNSGYFVKVFATCNNPKDDLISGLPHLVVDNPANAGLVAIGKADYTQINNNTVTFRVRTNNNGAVNVPAGGWVFNYVLYI